MGGVATLGDVGLRLSLCEHVHPSCVHTALRFIYSSQFTGSVEALGKLTKLTRLCVRAGMGGVATFGDVGLRLSLCGHVHPSCVHAALRYVVANQFTGSVDVLGKLTKLTYLCVRAGMDDVATLLVASLYKYGRLEMSAPISVDC